MNPKKSGKLFAVVLLALFAYGCGSSLSLVTSESISIELPTTLAADDGQISTIGDPDFEPVILRQRVITITNNTTNQTTNNTINQTNFEPNSRNRNE
ncbi:MAG: hypothetical protein KKF16_04430 [Euryarchaeota archaeon]|nr:hypothetical protein [Euryarchaeota archaeon]MBU4547638.1 hypothetical protein [Euryarchaeota archaeon]MBV1755148.1 hypothetical protein [Methanobacterium sp.]